MMNISVHINNAVMLTIFFLCGLFIKYSVPYENLALQQFTWMRYPYAKNRFPTENSVDGDTSQQADRCAVSDINKKETEWHVDLNGTFSIHSVQIYYRDDATDWDNGYRGRFAGFYLYVSNTTKKDDGYLCFHEIQNGTNSPPPILTINCTIHGRYVIYYNKRNSGVIYPEYYSNYAFAELCEVFVNGCRNLGVYGENCDKPCPKNCQEGRCYIVNGTCLGCQDGYKGSRCETPCDNYFYGQGCNNLCGNCLGNVTCFHVNGTCLAGCAAGYQGDKCLKECNPGKYGLDCQEVCNKNCAVPNSCDHVTGSCDGICKAGWQGDFCNITCDSNFYGKGCNTSCGNCLNNIPCHHVNGSCLVGCAAGYKDDTCTATCNPGKYGLDCHEVCNENCDVPHRCDHVTGSCDGICKAGWQGDFCNITCNGNFYGKGCNTSCGNCLNKIPCHHVNGSCLVGCAAGYKDDTCALSCDIGSYGLGCNETCSTNCLIPSVCNHVTGVCDSGCQAGWKGDFCNKECDAHFYGPGCNLHCGNCLEGSSCHHVSGSCVAGCAAGYTGDRCTNECQKGSYGLNCTKTCNVNCKMPAACDHITGICDNGCKTGWEGDLCDRGCENKTYGQNCSRICGKCLNSTKCHQIDGNCPVGCEKGFKGIHCTQACESTSYGEDCKYNCSSLCANETCDSVSGECSQITIKGDSDMSTSNTAQIIGGVVPFVFICALVLIAVILIRRSNFMKKKDNSSAKKYKIVVTTDNQKRKISKNDNSTGQMEAGVENSEFSDQQYDSLSDRIYAKEDIFHGISVTNFLELYKDLHKDKSEKCKKEYAALPHGETEPCEIGKQDQNRMKNRYKSTLPYDHSRVILKTDSLNTGDYINANYINGIENEKEYIATQGPTANTVTDFWRMVWQENVSQIVMLTNLKEGSKIKCTMYWPEHRKSLTVGSFRIMHMEEKLYAYYIIRVFEVTHLQEKNQSRTVTQYHYTAWPDHGIPNALCLVVFHSHIVRTVTLSQSPVIVHCSAGVGRTGTYIALDALHKYGVSTGNVNVLGYVKTMRENRIDMVQTSEQYITIYLALYESFRAYPKLMKSSEFAQNHMEDTQVYKVSLRQEFQHLLDIRPCYSEEDYKFANLNHEKVNKSGVLPYAIGYEKTNVINRLFDHQVGDHLDIMVDKYRLYLMLPVRGRGNYINAIALSSYTKKNDFIIAPYPFVEDAVDLLRLLVDHDSSIVVSMDPLKDIPSTSAWFPGSEYCVTVSPFKVMSTSCNAGQNGVTITELQLSHTQNKDNELINVSVVEPESSVNTQDNAVLRSLVNYIFNTKRKGPVTVLSVDGVQLCGMFCAVHNAIQQLDVDGDIDIFTTVRQIQVRRPELCSSWAEYENCYRAVFEQIQHNNENVYSNT